MSTINFSVTEIDEIFSRVLGVLHHNISGSDLKHTITHSTAFARAYAYQSRVGVKLGDARPDVDKVLENIVNQLAHYAWVSNQIAHSLRYNENPILFPEGKQNNPLRYKPCDSKAKLFADLSSLEYNMDAGFMPVEFDELFHAIKNHLAAAVARGSYDRERQLMDQNADKARQIEKLESELVAFRSQMDRAARRKGKKEV